MAVGVYRIQSVMENFNLDIRTCNTYVIEFIPPMLNNCHQSILN